MVEDDFADFYRRDYVAMARLADLLTGSNLDKEDLAQDASAARTENGYVGGPTNGTQKITLASGDTASALWEGIGGPTTSEGPCPS